MFGGVVPFVQPMSPKSSQEEGRVMMESQGDAYNHAAPAAGAATGYIIGGGEVSGATSNPAKHSAEGTNLAPPSPIYTTELGVNDVLLGRGTGPCSHEGNVNFRNAIEVMRPLYVATPSRKAKTKVVLKTVESIKAKKGRFLRKVSHKKVVKSSLLTSAHNNKKQDLYEVVPDEVAFEKTKQAIRYVHYRKDADGKQLLDAKMNGGNAIGNHHEPILGSPTAATRRTIDDSEMSLLAAFGTSSSSSRRGVGNGGGGRVLDSPYGGITAGSSTSNRDAAPINSTRFLPTIEDSHHQFNSLFLPHRSLPPSNNGGSSAAHQASTNGGGSTSSVLQQLLDSGGRADQRHLAAAAAAQPPPPSLMDNTSIASALASQQRQQDAALHSLLQQHHQEANANHHIQQAQHHLTQAFLSSPAPAPIVPAPPPVGASAVDLLNRENQLLGSLLLGRSSSSAPISHGAATAVAAAVQHSPRLTSTTFKQDNSTRTVGSTNHDGTANSTGSTPLLPESLTSLPDGNGCEHDSSSKSNGTTTMTRPDSILLRHAIEDPAIRSLLMADDKCREIIESYSKTPTTHAGPPPTA